MICVFDVIEGPSRGKRFWLRENQRLEIGRISTADFSIPTDHHMSRHHLIIEATVSAFRVRDVGSANGTFVNNAKVSTLELCSGDKIRAGLTTFEVSLIGDHESPHARDGLAFNKGVAKLPSSANSTTGGEVSASLRSLRMIDLPEAISEEADEVATQRLYSASPSPDAASRLSSIASRNLSASNLDARETEVNAAVWFQSDFSPTPVPHLFHEKSDLPDRNIDLVALLQSLDPAFRLSVVLNVAQLGQLALELIEEWRNISRVLELSPQLCLLSSDGSEEFWTLIRNAMRREAMIIFGSQAPLSPEWLARLSDLLRSPTTLNELLNGSTALLRAELLEQAEFLVFEQNSTGKLALLVGHPG